MQKESSTNQHSESSGLTGMLGGLDKRIVAILVVASILLIIGVVVSKNPSLPNEARPSPTPSISLEAEGSVDGWKTYSNSNPSFSFKYPEVLTLSEIKNSIHHISLKDSAGFDQVKIDTEINSDSAPLSFWLTPAGAITQNGITWNVYPQSDYCEDGNCAIISTTYEANIGNYRFSIFLINPDFDPNTANLILSTFEFAD